MNTTNRGSRQSEYQRSIAGAGNVRSGGDERYGGGRPERAARSHGVGGEGSRGYGQDEFSRTGSRVEEGMERVSQRVSGHVMGKSLINWERLMTTCANRGAGP